MRFVMLIDPSEDRGPSTWEQAAQLALSALWFPSRQVPAIRALDHINQMVEVLPALEQVDDNRSVDIESELALRRAFSFIGFTASLYTPCEYADGLALSNMLLPEMLALLISKQRDYGHGNILKYGLTGVTIRLSDKLERIKNLKGSGLEAANESLRDSYMDVIGYCAIALMLLNGTFTLELGKAQ